MRQCAIRVVKVGGSLFDLPDLADRLRQWLARQTPAHHVLIAGGGLLADQVRTWHNQRPLRDDEAHWMCIDAMTVTAHLLHARLPEVPLFEDDRLLCQRVGERACTIFIPAHWLRHSEPNLPGAKLPHNWSTTSDSIAARLAVALAADELVLLKSALPAAEAAACELSNSGLVDAMFLQVFSELTAVRIVNMRADSQPEAVVSGLGPGALNDL